MIPMTITLEDRDQNRYEQRPATTKTVRGGIEEAINIAIQNPRARVQLVTTTQDNPLIAHQHRLAEIIIGPVVDLSIQMIIWQYGQEGADALREIRIEP